MASKKKTAKKATKTAAGDALAIFSDPRLRDALTSLLRDQVAEALAAEIHEPDDWEAVDKLARAYAVLQLWVENGESLLSALRMSVVGDIPNVVEGAKARQQLIDKLVCAFAAAHKADFGEKKSMTFNYGTVSLTKDAESIELLEDEAIVIAKLKKAGHASAVGIVETINKETLAVLAADMDDKAREALGFRIVKTGGEPKFKHNKQTVAVLREERLRDVKEK